MNMIERVARALAAISDSIDPDTLVSLGEPMRWSKGYVVADFPRFPLWHFYINEAEETIKAMREPTNKMIEA